jgi:hypothetical protein
MANVYIEPRPKGRTVATYESPIVGPTVMVLRRLRPPPHGGPMLSLGQGTGRIRNLPDRDQQTVNQHIRLKGQPGRVVYN